MSTTRTVVTVDDMDMVVAGTVGCDPRTVARARVLGPEAIRTRRVRERIVEAAAAVGLELREASSR